jgi:hypothetical protein
MTNRKQPGANQRDRGATIAMGGRRQTGFVPHPPTPPPDRVRSVRCQHWTSLVSFSRSRRPACRIWVRFILSKSFVPSRPASKMGSFGNFQGRATSGSHSQFRTTPIGSTKIGFVPSFCLTQEYRRTPAPLSPDLVRFVTSATPPRPNQSNNLPAIAFQT